MVGLRQPKEPTAAPLAAALDPWYNQGATSKVLRQSAAGSERKEETDLAQDPMARDREPSRTESTPGGPVWSYRGYRLGPGEFTTAMVHFFRAEVQRANVWRTRLDTTTNWAVVTTGAAISFAYTSPNVEDHRIIILDVLLVSLFLYIEARRYRYYELWSYRVRLMETDFYATMLVPPFHPAPDWAESLADNLLHPQFPISMLEAIGRRLRRNYLWIYLILDIAWVWKVWLHPTPTRSWEMFFDRAAIGSVPGLVVVAVGIVVTMALVLMALLTVGLQRASGEVLPRYPGFHIPGLDSLGTASKRAARLRAWFRPSRQRQKLLAYVITDQAQVVADGILHEMRRGVTALTGTGMYTHHEHAVLMCALTVTEVPHLKALVNQLDPKAFVVVSPAQDVLGEGFNPLAEAE